MKCQITGKNVAVTEAIRSSIELKLKKMDKYFIITDEVQAKVLIRTYKNEQKIEVTIFTPMMDFRVEVKHEDLYAAIDLAVDKLEGQMRKLKTRLDRRHRESLGKSIAFENFEAEIPLPSASDEIVRVKEVELLPTDMETAITKMEALGHNFYVYLDEEDDVISVLYKRDDGGYGVIQAHPAK